ncbi:hypothetical protein ACFWHN_33260, partial [Streptomyces yangpuensis]
MRGEDAAEALPETVVTAAAPHPDDPAALLLAAMGPTGRLWSRTSGPAGRDALLEVGLGAGSRVSLPAVGALGIAGPRPRLSRAARGGGAPHAGGAPPGPRVKVLRTAARGPPHP